MFMNISTIKSQISWSKLIGISGFVSDFLGSFISDVQFLKWRGKVWQFHVKEDVGGKIVSRRGGSSIAFSKK